MTTLLEMVDASASARLCLTLAHSLWQFGLLAITLWLGERLGRRLAVGTRYRMYVAGLLAGLAALPLTYVRLSAVGAESVAGGAATPGLTAMPEATAGRGPGPVDTLRGDRAATAPSPRVATSPHRVPQRLAVGPSLATRLRRAWRSVCPWIAIVYVAGVLLMLMRLFYAVWGVQKLRARAAAIEPGPLTDWLATLAARWRLFVLPILARVEGIAVPRVVGLLRPTILLPAAALVSMPAHELEMIVAHELAHVRRYDLWVHFLQRLAEAVLFFNPGLWYLSRRISELREFCCDELACRAAEPGDSRLQYAEALLHVAELQMSSAGRRRAEELARVSALAASGRSPSELRRRVAVVLGEPMREPLQLSRGGVVALAALVLLFVAAPAIHSSSSEVLAAAKAPQRTELADQPPTPPTGGPSQAGSAAGAVAVLSGRIVMADGAPATAKGWLYSEVKQPGHSWMVTEGQFAGHFAADVRPGTVWLKYFPDGSAPLAIGPFDVAPGQKRDDLEFVLREGISATLRIRDERGQPVPGAKVAPVPLLGGPGTVAPHIELESDETGSLRIEHLAATPYQWTVKAPHFQPLRTETAAPRPGEVIDLTLEPSLPVTGTVLRGDGSPAAGAVVRYRAEVIDTGAFGMSGEVVATADVEGRFVIDGLQSDADHLFLFEAADGARKMVTDLQAGESDVVVEIPPRRDLRVRLIGDLAGLSKRRGKPYVGVRQRFHAMFKSGRNWGDLLGEDVNVTPTDEGGIAEYRGLIAGDVEVAFGKQTEKVPVAEGVTEVVLQLPRQQGQADKQKAIQGRVVDPDGAGIAGAEVALLVAEDVNNNPRENGPFAATTKTDDAGNYRLPVDEALLKDRRWGTLWAHASGYAPTRLRSTASLAYLANRPAIVLELDPAEGTRVRIVDQRSRPMANARVRVVRVKVKDSIGWLIPVDWQERFEATTDDEGLARIPSFEPAALNHLRVDSEAAGRVEYDQNYFLNVRPQQESPQFEFVVADAGRVEGVLQGDGEIPQGITVRLRTRASTPKWPHGCVWGVAEVIPDGDGRFTIPKIAAGQLMPKLELPSEGPWRADVPTRLQVEAGKTRSLEIPIQRGVRIRGLIREKDTGRGYPDFDLAVIYGPSAITYDDMDDRVDVHTDQDGYFTAYVPPGPIELRLISAPRDYHHTQWWDGGVNGGSWGSRREVPQGVEEFELPPIDLAPTELIEGTLVDKDGAPLSGWLVYGYPEQGQMNSFSGVKTDEAGRFSGYVPRPYPPRLWQVVQRTDKKTYRPKSQKYEGNVISKDPLVLEVGERIED